MNLEQLFSLDDDVLTLSEERKTFLKKGVHPGIVLSDLDISSRGRGGGFVSQLILLDSIKNLQKKTTPQQPPLIHYIYSTIQ